MDSLYWDWISKNYIHIDENCRNLPVGPVVSDSIYIDRLSRIPSIIEMPFNDVVKKYIEAYTGRLRNKVSFMLAASNFYMPMFEEALDTYDLPLELKYLPIIESALNPKATSRVGAAGLWQFMIATGKQYGLEVTSLVDERRDPIKSSYAAARYLKDLYDMFGDWTLVIASYNCGPNNTLKAITRAGGVKDYWKIYPYLPAETRGYVPAFIAANYVMNYYCQHNICPLETNLPQSADTLNVTRNVYMEQIVDLCGVSMDEVKALNPQYRTNLIPGESRPCTIKLPSSAVAAFLTAGDSIYTHRIGELAKNRKMVEVDESKASSSSKGARTVTVRKGDTLGSIAQRNRTTVTKIKRLNGLKNNNIRVGQKLRVR